MVGVRPEIVKEIARRRYDQVQQLPRFSFAVADLIMYHNYMLIIITFDDLYIRGYKYPAVRYIASLDTILEQGTGKTRSSESSGPDRRL